MGSKDVNVIAVIQARVSSRRLPGKVLKLLGNHSMLEEVWERVSAAQSVGKVVVATSSDPSDDALEELCTLAGIPCIRGPLDDVLTRYYQAAMSQAADHIVRITADCPLLDPSVLDQVVNLHLKSGAPYTSNVSPRTYPDGLDVEVMTFELLKNLHKNVVDPRAREHVTLDIHQYPELYRVEGLKRKVDYSAHRWTVDTLEDFTWVEKVIQSLGKSSWHMEAVISWAEECGCVRWADDDTSIRANDRLEGKGQKLYTRAKKIIPGGTQLLSKRPEMFLPGRWPAYYQSARGAWVKDLDGRSYLDMSTSGIGSCILGTADPYVNARVAEAVSRGSMSTLNPPEEVELAEKLCEIHPWASKVRFARTGGESASIAIRIARAATGKDVVLIGGYHGWSDWYLAANLSDGNLDDLLLPGLNPAGVPSGLRETSVAFHPGDTQEFEDLIQKYDGKIAAVVMEPQRYECLPDDFLRLARERTDDQSAVLIYDEITSGWRKNIGGIHLELGVIPDIAVFGKGMSNGYAMGAVIGKTEVMEATQDTFISSTYWTERIGPVAALATLERFYELDAPKILDAAGQRVQQIWEDGAKKWGVNVSVGHKDMVPLSHFSFAYEDADLNHSLKNLWCQEMLLRGVLDNGSFYATCAHRDKELDLYTQKVDEVFETVKRSLDEGTVKQSLGELSHQGFRRLTS